MHRPSLFGFGISTLCVGTLLAAAHAAEPTPPRKFASDGASRVLWLREFASPQEDWINELLPLRDGNYLAVGFLGRDLAVEGDSDWRALAVKLNASGDIVWQREHGAGGRIDAYWNAQEAADGRLGLAGFTTRIGAGGIDAYASILTPDGAIIKENAFGGGKYDRATDLALAADGGYVLAGFTESFGAGKRDVWLIKIDANGIEQWRRNYGGPGNDVALYIERVGDEGFVLAGGAESPQGDSEILVMKVDRDGNEVWRRTFGETGTDDINHGLAVLRDGRIVVPGYSKSWDSRDNDIVAAILTPEGEVAHIDLIGGPGDDRAMTAKADADGRVWIVGYANSTGAGALDVVITALDADTGFTNVFATFGGPADDNGTAILPLRDDSFLVAGYSENLATPSKDSFVMRVAAFADRPLAKDIRKRRVK